ncbi:MAG TPA: hypothetical protein VN578_15880, partial [Candidatus Binatia bacterium]|nr:hypothetical protein [Candidatus Binatia bacterium]
AVDAQSTAYVAGLTFSSDFPVSASAFRTNFVGPSGIAFLARINFFSPVLIITRAGGNLLLQWPASAPDYGLQSAPSLSPPIAWTPVQQSPVLNGGFYTVTLGPANGLAFFRLAHH